MTFRAAAYLAITSALSLSALAACGNPITVRARQDALKEELKKATEMGAKDCAPEEYARSQAQMEFALLEIDQGDYIRATDHLEEGFKAAKAAQRGAKNCDRAIVVKATPKPTVVVVLTPTPTPTPVATPIVVVVATPTPTPTPVVIVVKETPTPTPATPTPTPDVTKIDSDGDGTPDLRDECPGDPGPMTNSGCPVRDADGDGVPDGSDACPGTPGPAKYKGCPPPDRDKDGVIDDEDDCDGQAGPASNKGCPEFKFIVVNKETKRIELKQTIHFAPGKAIILADSFGILDEVAKVMKDNATMEVRIEGHTDSDGAATLNLNLSKARADAVKAYLVRSGIQTARMRSVGLGETSPIAENRTPEGKSLNRRVEFHITKE